MLCRTPGVRALPTLPLVALALALATGVAGAQLPRNAAEARMPERARAPQVVSVPAAAIPDLTAGDTRLDVALRNLSRSVAAQGLLRAGAGGEAVVPVLVRGSVASGALRAIGADVESEIGPLRTVRVPLSALSALLRLPGIERITLGSGLRPELDVSVPQTHADLKRKTDPPLYGWYGKNVVVGIVDTGFDYQHDDFRNPDGTTRFASIWDQTTAGVPPSGFSYGNECTTSQINAGTCGETDVDGHGSHVLGIAAGDGSATGNLEPQYVYTGMANGAQLLGVKTDFSFQGVVDGVNYIFQRAAALGKPAVVNLSLGSGLGPHDGTSDFELALNALSGAGKIIVASAGNAQLDAAHASADVQVAAVNYSFSVPTYTANSGGNNDWVAIDFWHPNNNSYSVRVKRPSSATLLGPVAKGASNSFSTTDGNVIVDYTNINDPNGNAQSEIYIEINVALGTVPRAGAWYVQLTPVSVPGTPKVHGWMDSVLGTTASSSFTANLDTTVIVSQPATADSVIGVASYTSKQFWASVDGNIYHFTGSVDPYQISPFSARGPRRDGAQKPDITAPGSAIGSVLSADVSSPILPLTLPDGVHWVLQGTSMAAPHVTGAIAMLLQKTPTLGPRLARTLLAGGARSDGTTGAVPNPRWGAGKLDLSSLLCSDKAPPEVLLMYPQPGTVLYQGTTIGINWRSSDDLGTVSASVDYHIGSQGAWLPIATGIADRGYVSWVVPNGITDSLQVRVSVVDCVNQQAVALSPFLHVAAPSVDVAGGVPASFAAYHPTPNPFLNEATLRFDLPAAPAGHWPVEVTMFNVAGRRVRTLVHGQLAPGRYAYTWDGRDDSGVSLAAGIYFVRIAAGPFEGHERVLYLR